MRSMVRTGHAAMHTLVALAAASMALTGCGAGGYAGDTITSLSTDSVTIDAGQSFQVTAALSGNAQVSWTTTGDACSAAACGTLSSTTGTAVTYTAPAGLSAQMKVTLTAGIAGTKNAHTTSITVNPDPVISGTPPAAVVGTPYSATLTSTGGTAPLKWMAINSLPGGLTFNTTTGVISGTPTTSGAFNFSAELIDSSDVPYTAKSPESIAVSTAIANLVVVSGQPAAGTVGVAYTTTLSATGGTLPYAWSVTSGSLPAGLSLSASTGVISGTPTTAGTSTFTAQVEDGSSTKASASFSIIINSAGNPLTLTLANLPGATVGVPYNATVGVSGGSAPYTCLQTAGAIPAGLTLSSSCVVSGTPTTAGTFTMTVKATDSSSPVETTSGPETVTVSPAGTLAISSPPSGTVGTPYSGIIGVAGGSSPYSCSIVGGSLPSGLSLGAGCAITGTPTVAGTASLTVTATDSSNPVRTFTGPVSLTIAPSALTLTLSTLPGAVVGVPYTATVGVSGGTAPYSCQQTGGNLPAGLTLAANCVVSGTPTAAGTSIMTVKATDTSSPIETTSGPESITVAPAGSLSITSPPSGTVGTPYSGTIGVGGGTAPYSCVITAGTLPAGLTLGAGCVVTGTPTVAGTSSLSVKATDSANPIKTTTGPVSLTINPALLTLTLSTLPDATVGVPYSATIGVAGGTAPYACSQNGGNLPPGLTLAASCVVSGTPTTAGSFTVTAKATDSGNPVQTTTGPETIKVAPAPLSLTLATLPGATVGVPYSATIGVSGGTAPYACSQTAGTLPAGLTLAANCVVSGTPTASGTSTMTVKATDASNPVENTSGPESITVAPAPLSLTLSTLPGATVGVPYSATIGVSGGTAPYACSQTGGTLPAGLTLAANCVVSGTPTTTGTSTMTVKATDTSNPVETTSGPESITVAPAALSLTLSNLPNATVGTPYSATIGVTGGTAPYACSLIAGTLPGGLTLAANCVVSGTPTVAETVVLTVKATDGGSPVQTTSGPVGLTVVAAPPTLTLSNPPNATVNVPYTGIIGVSGGQSPYTCSITAGTLPTGLTLTGCTITGTATVAGTSNLTVKATDASNPVATTTGPVTLTVLPATVTLTLSSPPNGTVQVPYTGSIGVSGGTAPYTCTQTGGTLPAGLTLASNCSLSGTPTTAGTTSVTIHVTDSASPVNTTTGPVSITISPIAPLSLTGSLPNATLGLPYTQTLTATGGLKPYTYSLTAGTLPPGLSLSSGGVISGTPTAPGATSFTVTVTDTETTPQHASLPLVLLVVYPTTPTDAELVGPYAFLFQGYDDVVAGVLAYQTSTIASYTADGLGVMSSGELDSNHQSSNPSGNTVSSNQFLGTYTLGTDSRGYMAITPLNADGTTGTTSIYAITVKAPVSPATVATQADMIEFDDNALVGTRGSGTMLAQQPTAFSAGLSGSYAFGLSGDTPCLPSCTLGIFAGPAAAVGAFTTNGDGLINTGTSDANIAQTNYANKTLTGSYGTADGNGRLELSMTTAGTPTGVYPTDYAVYLVNANQAFIMSTDKHSDYVLLAGTAQLQTQTTFTNASLGGTFVGYENAQSDPGLLSTTLQNTLNVSTATIFRTVGNGSGLCNFTNVDVAGLTGLVNQLTGLGGSLPVLDALLGKYQSTGTANCSVASNGRGVLNYPPPTGLLGVLFLLGLSPNPPAPREFYLVSPNNGYFLETGYAGLGRFEQQSGTPSTLGSLDGTYVYASQPAASLASINTSGDFTANGAGSATSTLDLNVGVGTLNVLQTDVTSSANYTLTNASQGRFVLGATTVIYELAPGRFVLVDTNALTTSPTITSLY